MLWTWLLESVAHHLELSEQRDVQMRWNSGVGNSPSPDRFQPPPPAAPVSSWGVRTVLKTEAKVSSSSPLPSGSLPRGSPVSSYVLFLFLLLRAVYFIWLRCPTSSDALMYLLFLVATKKNEEGGVMCGEGWRVIITSCCLCWVNFSRKLYGFDSIITYITQVLT